MGVRRTGCVQLPPKAGKALCKHRAVIGTEIVEVSGFVYPVCGAKRLVFRFREQARRFLHRAHQNDALIRKYDRQFIVDDCMNAALRPRKRRHAAARKGFAQRFRLTRRLPQCVVTFFFHKETAHFLNAIGHGYLPLLSIPYF